KGQPRLLHRMIPRKGEALNGGDRIRGLHGTYGNGTGALDLSIDVDRAGATLGDATAVFGSGQSELLAQHPEQRHIAADAHLEEFAIHVQLGHADVASDLVADLYSNCKCGRY